MTSTTHACDVGAEPFPGGNVVVLVAVFVWIIAIPASCLTLMALSRKEPGERPQSSEPVAPRVPAMRTPMDPADMTQYVDESMSTFLRSPHRTARKTVMSEPAGAVSAEEHPPPAATVKLPAGPDSATANRVRNVG